MLTKVRPGYCERQAKLGKEIPHYLYKGFVVHIWQDGSACIQPAEGDNTKPKNLVQYAMTRRVGVGRESYSIHPCTVHHHNCSLSLSKDENKDSWCVNIGCNGAKDATHYIDRIWERAQRPEQHEEIEVV